MFVKLGRAINGMHLSNIWHAKYVVFICGTINQLNLERDPVAQSKNISHLPELRWMVAFAAFTKID